MISHLLVSGAIRAAAILVLGLVAVAALSRRSAATRRAVLVIAFAAALVVPIVAAVGPSWRVEAPVAVGGFARESPLETAAPPPASQTTRAVRTPDSAVAAPADTGGSDVAGALLAVWLAGATALLARAIASQLRARRLARTGDPCELPAGVVAAIRAAGTTVAVRVCDGVDSPAVTGVVRPTVLLPRAAATWSATRLRVVLLHELAHVRQRDTLAQLAADVACAIHWFDPFVWLAAARLRVERELAADDAVLSAGVRASSYAEELLAVAGAATAGALAMSERTTLGARVVAILAPHRARTPLAARATALLVASSVVVAAAVACASPTRAARPSALAAPHATASTDPAAQAAADEVLARVVTQWSADSAVVVVLDASSGEILADAGRVGDQPADVARARAITPGSTIKPITIAAALEAGAITPTQLFECGPEPRRYPGGRELRDSSSNGMLDAAHLLAVSSNIGTSHIFDALGGEHFATWLGRFHVAEAPGALPASLATGSREGAEVAIGGVITATPLQMAAAYAALASDGVYHAPTTTRDASAGERVVSSATASQVMTMLDTAVTDPTATGQRARVDGVHVAGKTGTAELADADGHSHVYASFIGVADLPSRRVVALVGIETHRDGASGGAAAAPAFAQLISRLR